MGNEMAGAEMSLIQAGNFTLELVSYNLEN